jgi:ankyrin repeat protein
MDRLFLVAVRQNDLDATRALLRRGASVSVDEDIALDMAAAAGNIEMVSCLLHFGANVHARNESALAWAVVFGCEDIRSVLLTHGADENLPSVQRAYRHISLVKANQ